jgi:hypothetical protein
MTPDLETTAAAMPNADAHRLALEAIAALVYVKKTAADQVLRRAARPRMSFAAF